MLDIAKDLLPYLRAPRFVMQPSSVKFRSRYPCKEITLFFTSIAAPVFLPVMAQVAVALLDANVQADISLPRSRF